jgi:DNA replication protein DnaC
MEQAKATVLKVADRIKNREVPAELFKDEPLTTPSPTSPKSDPCLTCYGTGWHVRAGEGARRCECMLKAERGRALSLVPKEFGLPRLTDLAPDSARHPQQAAKFEAIKGAPEASYFIFGDNGTGKTLLGWALYVHAVETGRKAVMAELDALLKGYRRFQFRHGANGELVDDYRPPVMAEDLIPDPRRPFRHYTIFLDEIGATTPTEYAAKEFFYLLKAAHEHGHQTVFTCNVSPQELQAHWSRADAFWGNSIARRIAEYSRKVNLFR